MWEYITHDLIHALAINDAGDVLGWITAVLVIGALVFATFQQKPGPVNRGFLFVVGLLLLLVAFPAGFLVDFGTGNSGTHIVGYLFGIGMGLLGILLIRDSRKQTKK